MSDKRRSKISIGEASRMTLETTLGFSSLLSKSDMRFLDRVRSFRGSVSVFESAPYFIYFSERRNFHRIHRGDFTYFFEYFIDLLIGVELEDDANEHVEFKGKDKYFFRLLELLIIFHFKIKFINISFALQLNIRSISRELRR